MSKIKVNRKKLKKLIKENLGLQEGGFSRVRGMMMGLVPSVNSIGIMTAENPDAQPTPTKQNKSLNKSLMAKLREMNYGPIPIGGDGTVFEVREDGTDAARFAAAVDEAAAD